jgi:predicted GH43/DUF377 family glycosyl hydrolase
MLNHQRLVWQRVFETPFLGPLPGTVASEAMTTPDILILGESARFYSGAVKDGRERLIYLSLDLNALEEPATKRLVSAEIILEAGPQDFDSAHVFDPAIVSWRDKFHLYYSALGDGPESIGLAVSTNGVDFKKYDRPLLLGRSPEVIDVTGMLFLFYVLKNDLGEYRIHLARSADGEHFTPLSDEPVLTAGAAGEWDAGEVTTPRLFSHNGIFYMLYSGSSSPERKDIPQAFGLARSTDLLKWEKFPGNPVFHTGEEGNWDDGALWFGTVFEWRGWLYLIYEGGRMDDILDQSPALTQVGLAKLSLGDFDRAVSLWS